MALVTHCRFLEHPREFLGHVDLLTVIPQNPRCALDRSDGAAGQSWLPLHISDMNPGAGTRSAFPLGLQDPCGLRRHLADAVCGHVTEDLLKRCVGGEGHSSRSPGEQVI